MKPNIFIVGPSGTGKSTSMRNLPPDRTIILNTEQKALPFPGAAAFKMNVPIATIQDYDAAFDKAILSDKADIIVIESFTSLIEQIYREGSKAYSGFDFWDFYKKEVDRVLHKSKNTNKWVIFLGIDGVFEGSGGVEERYIAVDGSWKKKVEKEFVCVLFSNMYSNEQGDPEYRFITNKQKGFENVSAKSPMDMFDKVMPNDLMEVINKSHVYYNPPAPEGPVANETVTVNA